MINLTLNYCNEEKVVTGVITEKSQSFQIHVIYFYSSLL